MSTIDKATSWWQHLNPTDQWQWIAILVILMAIALSGKRR